MAAAWSDNSRKAAKEFVLYSLLFGSIIFLVLMLVGWITHAGYMKELFGLWMLCIVAFGPFVWAILGIVRDASKW
jgi:hypothetical protein